MDRRRAGFSREPEGSLLGLKSAASTIGAVSELAGQSEDWPLQRRREKP